MEAAFDTHAAVLAAVRVFVAVGLAAVFWIATAWPAGDKFLVWAACRHAITPDPARATQATFRGFIFAAVPTYVITFYVLPQIDGFAMFVLALLPLIVVGVGIGVSLGRAGEVGVAMILLGSGMDPTNTMRYNVVVFFNGVLATIMGVGVACLTHAITFPTDTAWKRRVTERRLGQCQSDCWVDQSDNELRYANAARGHKLTRLSISAEALEDLDLEAKTAEANYQQALAVCENAQINFDRTVVHSPVNGYVTNLVLDVGDYADAGKPVLAVVDQDSFLVEAYLEETKLKFVRIGDLAIVIPLSGAPAIKGEVDSIARGIGDTQNPTGSNLLQNVNATFEWVRLAQRIPVRIRLINVPKDTILSSGMTVTVSIMQETGSKKAPVAEMQ
jgi:hypothetical protein